MVPTTQAILQCSQTASDMVKITYDIFISNERSPLCFIMQIEYTSGEGTVYLPGHLSSPPVFSGVSVTGSLVLCVCFVDRCLSF
jgi:hypothetical protein